MRPVPSVPLLPRLLAIGVGLAAGVAGIVAAAPVTAAPSPPLAISAAKPAAPKPATTPLAGLKVLLTNDDSARGADAGFGTDGKGLYVLRRALCAAGADVLVVAPWSQQSGAGARMTTPGFAPVPLTVQAVSVPTAYAGDCAGGAAGGAVFGVCAAAGPCGSTTPSASPADAVNVALSRFARNYWSGGPDVVLSGTNFGQNIGATLNHSGTVGAAITAHEYAVPAVAVSAEVPRDLAQIPNVPFAAAADFAVRLLGGLVRRGLLRDDLVLNVNYPFVGAGERLGRAVNAEVGRSSDLGLTFAGEVPASGGTYLLSAGAPAVETRRNADTTALADNDIPVTALDGDWGRSMPVGVRLLLGSLR
ncbi:5'/3'-nucleotidase SurE [Nocardioides nitrophenolicus]|uniref:5'/3'-nucleotidase SurE n=1 Tax=Nocardioides nitrophenolicus TaxID=60489 RepID=UPI00195BDE1F|nr:5'/3'-nucleotidase SurE [Nocardioides nitrophenolicus]MBM7519441.1 5'-nucleotidase [Nocardioides nitrophenolicus]